MKYTIFCVPLALVHVRSRDKQINGSTVDGQLRAAQAVSVFYMFVEDDLPRFI